MNGISHTANLGLDFGWQTSSERSFNVSVTTIEVGACPIQYEVRLNRARNLTGMPNAQGE